MRKFFSLFLLVLSMSVNATTYAVTDDDNSKYVESIKTKYDYTKLIDAIIYVESRGNEKARNPKGDCCGVLQITPVLVKQVNIILGYKKYTLNDRFNREKSIEMFYIMQDKYNPTHNIKKAISIWNRGEAYYKRVMRVYNKKNAEN